MKKYLLLLMLTLVPTLLMAQVPGGNVKRPVKKQQVTPKSKQKTTVKSATSTRQPSRSLPSAVQTLINNMVYVDGGTFTMGATSEQGSDAWNFEKPTHQVTLSSFQIGKYEVTQEEWQAVMGSNPSYFKGDSLPVEQVSWEDCQEFILKLNALTGKRFRLPTEAEWEYAARGGNRSRGYKYAGSNDIDDIAWFWKNSGNQRLNGEWSIYEINANNCQTHPVGQKSPNELGLYDMSGNVWEWCQDWYGSYNSSAQTNPIGAGSGSNRVLRGGCWINNARDCRSSHRIDNAPSYRVDNLGLRLAL